MVVSVTETTTDLNKNYLQKSIPTVEAAATTRMQAAVEINPKATSRRLNRGLTTESIDIATKSKGSKVLLELKTNLNSMF